MGDVVAAPRQNRSVGVDRKLHDFGFNVRPHGHAILRFWCQHRSDWQRFARQVVDEAGKRTVRQIVRREKFAPVKEEARLFSIDIKKFGYKNVYGIKWIGEVAFNVVIKKLEKVGALLKRSLVDSNDLTVAEFDKMWVKAGNLVQWKAPKK